METTTIEIRKETHGLLKSYAEAHGFKISRIGDKILRDFLEEKEKEKMSLDDMPLNDVERKESNKVEDRIETMVS